MGQIKLDFYAINYDFCKTNYFSNEKISTFLAIMDYLLHHMLERQMMPEDGFKLLKRILEKHSLQRPPFSILIFDRSDIEKIVDFTLKTFFRHFILYEFSFKPRRELVLKCEPFMNLNFNARQYDLQEMAPVDAEEAERMKGYLSIYQHE